MSAKQVCKAILELHALADEVCAGFGTPSGSRWTELRHRIEMLLEEDYEAAWYDVTQLSAANVRLASGSGYLAASDTR